MSASATGTTRALDVLFTGLIDDAAVFPPAELSITDAVAGHREHRRAWYADLVGPLLCAASRAPELRAAVGDEPLRVGWIARPGAAAALDDLRAALAASHDGPITVTGVELASGDHEPAQVVAALDAAVPVWIEVNRHGSWRTTIDQIAAIGGDVHAKLRTGGTAPTAVPTVAEIAAFVVHTVAAEVAFKLTAGLHHAVRHTDPATGVDQHGVLNVCCAVDAALAGADVAAVAELLDERDHATVVATIRALDAKRAGAVRATFRSFGCCDVGDPVRNLVELGLSGSRP